MKERPRGPLVVELAGWATQMYARFGHPVYLVGSAIEKGYEARDVDVVIELPDDEFEARYGDVGEWGVCAWSLGAYLGTFNQGAARQRWSLDMGKLSSNIARMCGMNVDFKVMPASYARAHHGGRVRLRLDRVRYERSPQDWADDVVYIERDA